MADYRMITLKADATPIVRGARMVSAQGDVATWLEAAQKAADRAGKSTATVQVTNGGGRLVVAFTVNKEGKVQAPAEQAKAFDKAVGEAMVAKVPQPETLAMGEERRVHDHYLLVGRGDGKIQLFHAPKGGKKTDLTAKGSLTEAHEAIRIHQEINGQKVGAQGTVTEVPVIRTNSPGQAGPVLIKKGVVQGLVDLLTSVPPTKPGYTVDELVEQLVTAFGGSPSSRKNTVRTQMSASWLPKTRGLTIIKTPVEGKGTHYRAELPEEEGDDVE